MSRRVLRLQIGCADAFFGDPRRLSTLKHRKRQSGFFQGSPVTITKIPTLGHKGNLPSFRFGCA